MSQDFDSPSPNFVCTAKQSYRLGSRVWRSSFFSHTLNSSPSVPPSALSRSSVTCEFSERRFSEAQRERERERVRDKREGHTHTPRHTHRQWESLALWQPWIPRWRRARQAKAQVRERARVLFPSVRSVSRLKSGMLWRSGRGILSWTTARFAATISWICVLSAKRIRLVQRARSAQSHGVFATTPSISIASADG